MCRVTLRVTFQPPLPPPSRAYAYAFVALGEMPAAIVGWCMTLEYGFSAAAVAKSWGEMVGTAAAATAADWLISQWFSTYDNQSDRARAICNDPGSENMDKRPPS